MERIGVCERVSKETNISLSVALTENGSAGSFNGSCGVGFFDHMMTALCVHGGMKVELKMTGDLEVDAHHSIEDLGIVFGTAFAKAVGDKGTICRYGNAFVPMDEALAQATLDISARPYLVFDCDFSDSLIGAYPTQLTEEFFRAFAQNAGITLHIRCLYGKNDHHKTEAVFKAVARALAQATALRDGGALSSKGIFG